jgi:hypothetical protein
MTSAETGHQRIILTLWKSAAPPSTSVPARIVRCRADGNLPDQPDF